MSTNNLSTNPGGNSAPAATQPQTNRIRIQSEPVHIPSLYTCPPRVTTSTSSGVHAQAQDYTNTNNNFNNNQRAPAIYTDATQARIPIPQAVPPSHHPQKFSYGIHSSPATAMNRPGGGVPLPALGPPPAYPPPLPPHQQRPEQQKARGPADISDRWGSISRVPVQNGIGVGNQETYNMTMGYNGHIAHAHASAPKDDTDSPPLPPPVREAVERKVMKWRDGVEGNPTGRRL